MNIKSRIEKIESVLKQKTKTKNIKLDLSNATTEELKYILSLSEEEWEIDEKVNEIFERCEIFKDL
jgi:hypothetical protein